MRRGSERKVPHIGTETRTKLLREAAVRNIGQWAQAWTSQVAWGKTVLRIVNLFCRGVTCGTCPVLRVPEEKASANSVPAAAVIRRMRALSGFIGFKGCAGGAPSQRSKFRAQPGVAVETGVLECVRGRRNALCSGEMHRYDAELRLRRQLSSALLTLRHESVGIEQD